MSHEYSETGLLGFGSYETAPFLRDYENGGSGATRALGDGPPQCGPGEYFDRTVSLCKPGPCPAGTAMKFDNRGVPVCVRVVDASRLGAGGGGVQSITIPGSGSPSDLAFKTSGFDIRNFWAARSTLQKGLIIGGALAAVGGVAYVLMPKGFTPNSGKSGETKAQRIERLWDEFWNTPAFPKEPKRRAWRKARRADPWRKKK